jgi:hypothetical protein
VRRLRAPLALTALALCGLVLTACGPQAPKGISHDALEAAINGAIGDPNSCVLIGDAKTGRVVYQFGSHVTCGKEWPSCGAGRARTTDDLLKVVVKDPSAVQASCSSNSDGSRGVGWAAGLVDGHPDLAYAAAMEGKSTPPGVIIADKLKVAFKAAGL